MTLEVTGQAQLRSWMAGELPPVERVRDRIWSIPVPFLADPRTRYTNCYVIAGDGEALVIDPGFDTDDGWEVLLRGLEQAGVDPERVTGIVATHCHPDHLGLAGRLRARSGAWLALSTEEHYYRPTGTAAAVVAADAAQLRSWAVPEAVAGGLALPVSSVGMQAALAEPDVRLTDGQVLQVAGTELTVVLTPGHTPGHLCLVDLQDQVVFTGDHVLPRIRPHVLPGPVELDLLSLYLDSLGAMIAADGLEVLPAHEFRFDGLHTRVADLERWHVERADQILEVVGATDAHAVWDVAAHLRWSRPWDRMTGFVLRIALGETASHLTRLERAGRLPR